MTRIWSSLVALLLGAVGALSDMFMWKRRESTPSKPSISVEELKALEQKHVLSIAEKKRQIEALKSDLHAHAETIVALEKEVEADHAQLATAYKDSGMSAEEIAKAFEGLKL